MYIVIHLLDHTSNIDWCKCLFITHINIYIFDGGHLLTVERGRHDGAARSKTPYDGRCRSPLQDHVVAEGGLEELRSTWQREGLRPVRERGGVQSAVGPRIDARRRTRRG